METRGTGSTGCPDGFYTYLHDSVIQIRSQISPASARVDLEHFLDTIIWPIYNLSNYAAQGPEHRGIIQKTPS